MTLGVIRGVVSLGMLVLGIALGASAFAMPSAGTGPKAVREGGTFRIGARRIDFVDPALAYFPASWALLEATCAKLMNYPDQNAPTGLRAVPEVAAAYPTVSPDGRVYKFRLRPGFRFSNGAKLTARSFQRAIERLADPAMESPAAEVGYVQDIVGAERMLTGQATSLSGVVATGNRLMIRLTRRVPDFTARLAMPFFCAVPPDLPANPEGAGAYPSAGPYYVVEYLPGRRLTLRENRHYHGRRPHHVDRFVVTFASTPTEVVDLIEAGTVDWASISPPVWASKGPELARKYGRSSRLRIRPSTDLFFYILNTRRGIFRGNAELRRAVNFAVDRSALVRLQGFRIASATDQYLPPAMPGFKDVRIYPSRPNLARARKLARGRLRNRTVVLYTANVEPAAAEAQVLKANLARIGLEVEIKQFPLDLLLRKIATPNEPFDMAWGAWGADYPDPYGILNPLLGDTPYFRSRTYRGRLQSASRLRGAARYRAYAKLDAQLARKVAPLLAYATRSVPTFVSRKVDPRCMILRPALDLAAVCLKK